MALVSVRVSHPVQPGLQLVPNGKDGVYAVDRSGTPLASYTYWKGFKRGTAAGLTFEAERAAARRP
jgi:hypothetical protein